MATLYVENVPDDLCEAMILANRLTWMCWAGCYDALMARCAIKARAEAIFTWNIDYFRRVGPEVAKRVRTPQKHGCG
jgi:hypothetical protein